MNQRERNALDRWILRGPPEYPDECTKCHAPILADMDIYEWGNEYICLECYETYKEQGEDHGR